MKYELVFQGGGARGMVLVGAYAEFVARGHTPGRLPGTSAGAITATLIAAGYTPDEILAALEEREGDRSVFAAFLGRPKPFGQQEIRASVFSTPRDVITQAAPEPNLWVHYKLLNAGQTVDRPDDSRRAPQTARGG